MPYTFPPDVEELIREQVESGDFTNEDEVIREALGALKRKQEHSQKLKAMIAEAEEDIANGRVGQLDLEASKQAVLERLAKSGNVG